MRLMKLSVLNASSAFGRVLPTVIADKVGVFNLIVPCTLVCGTLIFGMIGVVNAGGSMVIAILYGFFSGACEFRSHDIYFLASGLIITSLLRYISSWTDACKFIEKRIRGWASRVHVNSASLQFIVSFLVLE